jgi:hypothetical protein
MWLRSAADCIPSRSSRSRAQFGADWRNVSTEAAVEAGSQLDVHHVPETNGRMSVCRRCGSQTDGPEGQHHTPAERQLIRSSEWLVAESKITQIDRIRGVRNR